MLMCALALRYLLENGIYVGEGLKELRQDISSPKVSVIIWGIPPKNIVKILSTVGHITQTDWQNLWVLKNFSTFLSSKIKISQQLSMHCQPFIPVINA